MCANFKPLTLEQLHNLGLPEIPFEYPEEVYPNYATPLLFHSAQGNETLLQKPTFAEATAKCHFGVIPVSEFYESKYFDNKPQRWGVRRKDGQATFIAAVYEIARVQGEIVRSASMITMDAIDHPMMKEFHEPGNIKRSVIVIPQQRLQEWLTLRHPDIRSFVEGFPVEDFECSHVPKEKIKKVSPQLNFFDF